VFQILSPLALVVLKQPKATIRCLARLLRQVVVVAANQAELAHNYKVLLVVAVVLLKQITAQVTLAQQIKVMRQVTAQQMVRAVAVAQVRLDKQRRVVMLVATAVQVWRLRWTVRSIMQAVAAVTVVRQQALAVSVAVVLVVLQ
jgi:hypothetical protein